ncbi:MAG: hypothetical protein COA84_12765 [Robiginitomaculum sp.]|nr:MAG: hypothetical protein COA84_12765 [Robiginitomaculum sp.]
MIANPQSMNHDGSVYSRNDAVFYLAAILPELAKIARQSNIDDLDKQIERAATLVQNSLLMRER